MKSTILLLSLVLCACSPPDPSVSAGTTEYQMGDGSNLKVKTILIEGNEYLAFYMSDSRWGLCPKTPATKEGIMQVRRPETPYKPSPTTNE